MFHHASQIFWSLVQPVNLTGILIAASILLALLRWKRLSLAASGLSILVLALSAWTTVGALLLQPLEDRFERPATMPERVDGIVVLGGGFEGGINLARGGYELNASGDRLVETAVLALEYPDARILVSGGTGSIFLEGEGDAATAPRLMEALGIDRARLVLENRSRDTYENAIYSKQLAEPKPGETWLLVTSAFHMPRAVGTFRAAGFPVVPWPVDYRTAGTEGFGLAEDNVLDSLDNTAVGVREWIALFAYRLTGRTESLLPAPR